MLSKLTVDSQTKECGIFWAGDEFSQNSLPKGWEIKSGNGFLIFDEQNAKNKCESLGYRYIGDVSSSKSIRLAFILISALIIVILFSWIVIRKKRRNSLKS